MRSDEKMLYVLLVLLAMGFILLFNTPAHAQAIPEEKAILTLIGEQQGNFEGMLWVASVIRNRGTLRGAYGLKNPNVVHHRYTVKDYKMAKRAWELSFDYDFSQGCCHWFSLADLKQPKVQRIIREEHLEAVKTIGIKKWKNTFYRKKALAFRKNAGRIAFR